MEEKKKNILKDWRLWIGVGIIAIIITVVIMLLSKPKFEIANFSITSDTTDYTYTNNSTVYNGKGLIITQKKSGTYLVALKVNLKSGGTEDSESYCTMVMVNEGKGEFTTYDYGEEGKITKPEYEFEILGYVKF